jgi:lysophospholipid acyltransferase (LPLAT)-like uncharacterized protein
MFSFKRIGAAPRVQKAIGGVASEYLRLVWKTNRFVIEPEDIYDRFVVDQPIIVAMWHGQHFMMPFFKREQHRVKVLISRHRDGEINAIAAGRLGIESIRGSGTHGNDFHRKGGVSGFKAMVDALQEGYIVAVTADVPKVSRVAGPGIVRLARAAGGTIYPVAVATSRRIELDNWDRSAVNLPFGRGAIVAGEPIRVAADADDAAIEAARTAVEANLNAATVRAYAIVDQGGYRS